MAVKLKIGYGPTLTKIRRALDFSTTQMAARLGLAEGAIRHYEKGLREPDGLAVIRYLMHCDEDHAAELMGQVAAEYRELWERPLRSLAREKVIAIRGDLRQANTAGLKSLPQTSRPSTTANAKSARENLERVLEKHHERRSSRRASAKRAG